MAAEKAKQIEEAKKIEVGATNCEKAFNATVAQLKALEEWGTKMAEDAKKNGGKVTSKGSGKMPSKPKFIKACSGMPADVQQCMLTSYAGTHEEECKKVMTPEQIKRLKDALK
jgi:hypothetical protein